MDRREQLPSGTELLIGQADAVGYAVLQDTLGALMHGAQDWPRAWPRAEISSS